MSTARGKALRRTSIESSTDAAFRSLSDLFTLAPLSPREPYDPGAPYGIPQAAASTLADRLAQRDRLGAMGLRMTSVVTDRLELRPLVPEDADEMAPVLADERLHDFTGGHPIAPEQLRTRYVHLADGWSADGAEQWCNWIVRVQASGDAVGFVQATVTDAGRAATVAWVVGVRWQGQGYASEAAIAVVGWLTAAGVRTIEAHIHPDHDASARVAGRAGLVPSTDTVDGEVVWRRPADP